VKDVLPEVWLGEGERARRNGTELLMLQGTTVLFFEEEDGLVLVDYKTDRVRSPEELRERYSIQLNLYERALQQSTGKKVKEKWIWSTTFRKAIEV